MLMSRHQNAEQNHKINTSNRSFEKVAKFKYFRMTLTSQNFIHEEIQVDDTFFQQKCSMAMGSSLSPIISNIFTEHFKKLVLDSVQHKQLLWLWYADTIFVVWLPGPDRPQNFFNHLKSLGYYIQFSTEIESDSVVSFSG
jgi:hypothetical protein